MVGTKISGTKASSKQSIDEEKSRRGRKRSTDRKGSPGREESKRKESGSPGRGRPKSVDKTGGSPGREEPKKKESGSPGRGRPKSVDKTGGSPARVTKPKEKSRSPGRPRKVIVDLTKANKSPDRSSIPLKTPTKRSPIRRSPSRAVKAIAEDKEKASALPILRTRKQKIIVDTDTDSDTFDDLPEIKEKPKATVRGRTRVDLENDKDNIKESDSSVEFNSNLIKRVTRAQNREVERIVHLKHLDNVTKKLGEFSDEDEILTERSKHLKAIKDAKTPYEFGGPIGASILLLLTPLSVASLYVFCDESSCSFTKLPTGLSKYKNLSTYFDSKSVLGYVGYVLLLTLLSALPFGGKRVSGLPSKHEKLTYVMNGLFSLAVMVLLIIGLEIKNVPITNYIVDHLFHLLIVATLVGFVLTLYAYVRSFYVPISALNTHAVGKGAVYNFFMGREINPRLFGIVDLKMFVLRLALIGVILVDFSFVYKSLDITLRPTGPSERVNIDPKYLNLHSTVLVYFLLHSIYMLDGLIFEHTWVTSFEVQQEGFGFMGAVGYSIYPFMTATVIRYIVEYGVELETWKLVLTSLVFVCGYVLFRGSNSQKDAFRKNPYSPALAYLETIPTTQGKKLISSGFWGLVRHPNYLGDILINLSLVPFVVCAPPVLSIFLIILLLIHRSTRDNARCKQKYGAAWDRYCNKVKYILVPKVY